MFFSCIYLYFNRYFVFCKNLRRAITNFLRLLIFRFEEAQGFTELRGLVLEGMDVVDGQWYIKLQGDYAGRVSGKVFVMNDENQPEVCAFIHL